MSKQRIIKDEIWDDDWFYDLDPSEKLVWLFLLTNPRNNIAGVYKLNRRWGATSCGLDKDVFEVILKRFLKDEKISTYKEWLVLMNFHKHQSNNPKVEAGVLRILGDLPKEVFNLLPIDSLCIAYRTLLNSTLLNLSVGEAGASAGRVPPLLNLKDNKKDMGWNDKGDDFDEGVVDFDGDGSIKDESKPVTKKYPNAPAIRKIFQEILGTNPQSWRQHKVQLQSCENLFKERTPEKVRSALVFYKEHQGQEFCPVINSPYDLDAKWTKLGEFKLKQ
jgi:hypothetical protein